MKKTIVMLLAAALNVGVVPPLAFAQDKDSAGEEKKHKQTRRERREERREAKRQAREERAEKKRQAREERANRNRGTPEKEDK